eukprot:6413167-Ditylum_brightwellii.AAC.1
MERTKRNGPKANRTKKSKKADKDAPKRFRTAYNFFFMHEREVLLGSQPESTVSSDALSVKSSSSGCGQLTDAETKKMLSKTEKRKHVWAHGKIEFRDLTAH